MNLIKRTGRTILIGGIALGLFGCSFEGNQYSPEEVINNAMKAPSASKSYYAELEMSTKEKGKEIEKSVMKEWKSKEGKSRIEVKNELGDDMSIIVNDGKKLVTYEVDRKQAFLVENEELASFNQTSPREQANQLLEMIRDTHDISVKEGSKVADRATYHIVAKEKKEKTLFGDAEMWIDKENWMILKTIIGTGDTVSETIYRKIDFGIDIPVSKFKLVLPDDVEIKNVEDLSETTELKLDEIVENIGAPIYYFPEENGREITSIEMTDIQGELGHKEVNIDYKKEGLALLTLSVFKSPKETSNKELDIPGTKNVTIQGQDGSFTEMGDFRALSWQKDGMNYSILPIDPSLTLEKLIDLTDEMELIK